MQQKHLTECCKQLLNISMYSRSKIIPGYHVPLADALCAGFLHYQNLLLRKHFIKNMNLRQLPLKRLKFVKITPNFILLVPQDPSSSAWNFNPTGNGSTIQDNPISVYCKRSTLRSPRDAKVVPISIMNGSMSSQSSAVTSI